MGNGRGHERSENERKEHGKTLGVSMVGKSIAEYFFIFTRSTGRTFMKEATIFQFENKHSLIDFIAPTVCQLSSLFK
jgi:hypothetical protein